MDMIVMAGSWLRGGFIKKNSEEIATIKLQISDGARIKAQKGKMSQKKPTEFRRHEVCTGIHLFTFISMEPIRIRRIAANGSQYILPGSWMVQILK